MDSMKIKKGELKALEKVKMKNRFSHAFRGLYIFYKSTRNVKIHLSFCFIALLLAFYLGISSVEWMVLILAMFSVLVAEAFNTAIEIDIDLTSPEYHPFARDTKDVAAGAVLLTSFGAFIVGCIIFLPKILIMIE